MTKGERRRLVMELASQLPDDPQDAICIVEWLRRVALDNWAEGQSARLVRLVPVLSGGGGGGCADICA